jgi:hypothetical protein
MGGHYLPLGTIAWGISLYFLFGNVDFLGGHTGITGIPPVALFGWELKSGREFYYLIWLVVLLAISRIRNLLDSREGRAIRALKGGTVMAEAMGVNTPRAKIVIFLIAALLASVSGWLYAHLQRFVNPTPFALNQGIEYLFMAVVGGIGHVWGAVLGAGADHHPQAVAAGLAAADCSARAAISRSSSSASPWCWCCNARATACGRSSCGCCRLARRLRTVPRPSRCRAPAGRQPAPCCSKPATSPSASAAWSPTTACRLT